MTHQQLPTTYPIAHLERRFTAFAIDRLLAWSLLAAVGVVTALVVSDDAWTVVGVVTGVMAVVWLVSAIVLGVSGNSPGKAITGLRVVHHGDGTPIGVGPSLLRSLVLGISGLPTFGIGIATLAWTAVEDRGRQRRGWHDHLARTVVVDVRPVIEVADTGEDEGPRHIVNLTAMRLVPAPPVDPVRTPERTEHSMRRQPLPADLAAPPGPAPQASPPPPGAQASPQPQPQRSRPDICARRTGHPSGGSTSTTARASSSPAWPWSGGVPRPATASRSPTWSHWRRPTCRSPRPTPSSARPPTARSW